jgi:hypothetical protein
MVSRSDRNGQQRAQRNILKTTASAAHPLRPLRETGKLQQKVNMDTPVWKFNWF